MRSIKMMLLLACTAAVAVAFTVPAIASAEEWTEEGGNLVTGLQWSEDGSSLKGEPGSLTLAGSLGWQGDIGSIMCPMSVDVTLNRGHTGQVTKLSATAAACEVTGYIKQLCPNVAAVTPEGLPWSVTATESAGTRKITIAGVSLAYDFGDDCPPIGHTVTGTITATPNNSGSISNVSLSGQLFMPLTGGPVVAKGTLNASPAGKFGIVGGPTVAVGGFLQWTGAMGGMKCPVNGTIALESGGAGQLTSLDWDESGCEVSGIYSATCGNVANITSQVQTVKNEGTKIRLAGIHFIVEHVENRCTTHWTGDLFATPNNASAISSTSLSGTLKRGGVTNVAWSGSLNWTPAAIYGL
jgi:hypothetical protein